MGHCLSMTTGLGGEAWWRGSNLRYTVTVTYAIASGKHRRHMKTVEAKNVETAEELVLAEALRPKRIVIAVQTEPDLH